MVSAADPPAVIRFYTTYINSVRNSQETQYISERPLDARPLDSFPAFYGTRRFNTEFTTALHLFLS
jgi:hypothetical protein